MHGAMDGARVLYTGNNKSSPRIVSVDGSMGHMFDRTSDPFCFQSLDRTNLVVVEDSCKFGVCVESSYCRNLAYLRGEDGPEMNSAFLFDATPCSITLTQLQPKTP